MRKGLVVVVVVVSAVACGAAEWTEVGARLDLNLLPYREGGRIRWNLSIAVYGKAVLSDAWAARAVLGIHPDGLRPFGTIALLRTVTPQGWIEGELTLESVPRVGPTFVVAAGGRVQLSVATNGRLEIASLPFMWTFGRQLPNGFAFVPSVSVDATLVTPEGARLGQAVAAYMIQRTPSTERPVLALDPNWILGARLTSHMGFAL